MRRVMRFEDVQVGDTVRVDLGGNQTYVVTDVRPFTHAVDGTISTGVVEYVPDDGEFEGQLCWTEDPRNLLLAD